MVCNSVSFLSFYAVVFCCLDPKKRSGHGTQDSPQQCVTYVGRHKDTQSGKEGPYLTSYALIFTWQGFSQRVVSFFSALFVQFREVNLFYRCLICLTVPFL